MSTNLKQTPVERKPQIRFPPLGISKYKEIHVEKYFSTMIERIESAN